MGEFIGLCSTAKKEFLASDSSKFLLELCVVLPQSFFFSLVFALALKMDR